MDFDRHTPDAPHTKIYNSKIHRKGHRTLLLRHARISIRQKSLHLIISDCQQTILPQRRFGRNKHGEKIRNTICTCGISPKGFFFNFDWVVMKNAYPFLLQEQLVLDLTNPSTKETALLELSKKRESFPELAPFLWHSFGTMAALLQEIVSIYPMLQPPSLTAHASNRVCNALALLQCVESHPETRSLFLQGGFFRSSMDTCISTGFLCLP